MITTATTPLRCSMLPLQTNFVVCILSAKGQRLVWKGGKEARSKGMKESPVAAHGLFLKASKQTGAPPPPIVDFQTCFGLVSDCFRLVFFRTSTSRTLLSQNGNHSTCRRPTINYSNQIPWETRPETGK